MKRPLCIFGFTFIAAALTASFIPHYVTKWIILVGIVLLGMSVVLLRENARKIFAVCALATVAAMCMFYVKTEWQYNKVVTLADKSITFTGKVYDIKARDDYKYTYYVHADKIEKLGVPKFDVVIYSDVDLKADYYDEISMYTTFFLPSDNYGFDSVRYYKGENIFVLGHTDGVGVYVTKTNRTSVMYLIKDINRYLGNILDDMFDKNISSVVKAVILGDTDGLDFNLKQDYVYAGAYHIFAISGFHITIISGFIISLLSLLKIGKRKTYALTIIVIYVFTVFSGMHTATVRAAIMLTVMLVGKMLYQKSDSLNSLAISAIIICFANIYNVMSLSFILTFASSLGIILFSKRLSTRLSEKLSSKGTVSKLIIEIQSLTVSTSICLIPVYVFSFGYISVASFLSNLVVYFTATPIVILSLVLIILLMTTRLMFVIGPVSKLLELFIKAQNNAMSMLADFRYSTVGLSYDHIKLWLIASVIILVIFIIAGKGGKYIKKAVIISIVLLIGSTFLYQYSVSGSVSMYILGDGTVSNVIIVKDGNTTVISTDDDSYIDTQTLSFLRAKGINKIDTLIYTYTQFKYSEDTFKLIDNIEVECILYNKNNEDLYYMLNRPNIGYSLSEIDDCVIKPGDDMEVELHYINTKISADISCFDKKLVISNNMNYLSDTSGDIVLISESYADERISEISAHDIIMLRSQYVDRDCYDECIKGYENPLYLVIKENEEIKIKPIS